MAGIRRFQSARNGFKQVMPWLGRSIACIGIVFVGIRLWGYREEIRLETLNSANWLVIYGLILLYAASNLLLAVAWRRVLQHLGVGVSGPWAVRCYGISQMGKYIPGNIFHLAGRQALGMAAGLPSAALVKSSVWELGLLVLAGSSFVVLALPAFSDALPIHTSTGLFGALGILTAGLLAVLSGGRHIPYAFACYIGFLALSALIFWVAVQVVVPKAMIAEISLWSVGGVYVTSWLLGLLTPGAPAGIGVRESMLLLVLSPLIMEAELLRAVLLGRLITTAGDVHFWGGTLLIRKD